MVGLGYMIYFAAGLLSVSYEGRWELAVNSNLGPHHTCLEVI